MISVMVEDEYPHNISGTCKYRCFLLISEVFFGRLLMPEVVSKLKKLWSEGFKVSCLLRDDVI